MNTNTTNTLYKQCNQFGRKLDYKLLYFNVMSKTVIYKITEIWEYDKFTYEFLIEYDGYNKNVLEEKIIRDPKLINLTKEDI